MKMPEKKNFIDMLTLLSVAYFAIRNLAIYLGNHPAHCLQLCTSIKGLYPPKNSDS